MFTIIKHRSAMKPFRMFIFSIGIVTIYCFSPALALGDSSAAYDPVPSHLWAPESSLPDKDTLNVVLIAKNVSGSVTNTANQPVAHSTYRFVVNNVGSDTYVIVGAFEIGRASCRERV